MKFPICLLLTALCFTSALGLLTVEAYETLRNHQKHCVRLSGVPIDHLEMIRLDRKIYEDEYQEKFAVCMLKKFNIMHMDGSINEDTNSYGLITDNPEVFEAARGCKAQAGIDARETARKIMTCLLQTDVAVLGPPPEKSLP